ncbi:hypothetical protein RB195_016498 [Necator americanus]|uniref:Uncharacterized protein n=1 Tax=Necator americanus TaxID=51031 RepID=A0ABR1C0S0_NECAM
MSSEMKRRQKEIFQKERREPDPLGHTSSCDFVIEIKLRGECSVAARGSASCTIEFRICPTAHQAFHPSGADKLKIKKGLHFQVSSLRHYSENICTNMARNIPPCGRCSYRLYHLDQAPVTLPFVPFARKCCLSGIPSREGEELEERRLHFRRDESMVGWFLRRRTLAGSCDESLECSRRPPLHVIDSLAFCTPAHASFHVLTE